MEYHAQIEARNVESAMWQAIDSERTEENVGTAGDYGRRLLDNYLRQNPDQAGRVRVQVWAVDHVDGVCPIPPDVIALVYDAAPVPREIAAIEAGKEEVLHRRRALKRSIQQLDMRLREARKAGHRGSQLAELALPALAREHL